MPMLTDEVRAKRVAVARDVKLRLASEEYVFRRGHGYVRPRLGRSEWFAGLPGDLQEHVEVVAENCDVGLLGGFLLSKARLYNNVPLSTSRSHGDLEAYDGLEDVFDRHTASLMESAFESSGETCDSESAIASWELLGFLHRANLRRAGVFGQKAASAVDHDSRSRAQARVWAVANNLIANRGEFIVTQEPDLSDFPIELAPTEV